MSDLIEVTLARARAVLDQAEEVRAAADASVVRWEWVTEGAYEHRPEPLARERSYGPKRVRRFAERPPLPAQAEGYGFDEGGDIVRCRAGEQLESDELLRHEPDGVASVVFYEGKLTRAGFALVADGRVACTARVAQDGLIEHETFTYDDARLIGVDAYMELRNVDEVLAVEYASSCAYDVDGRLVEIVNTYDTGRKRVVYRASGYGRPKARVAADVEDELVRLVSRWAAERTSAEPVCSLLLQYDIEDPLPPAPAFVTEAHRERVLAADDPEGPLYGLWNVAELDGFDGSPLASEALEALATELRAVDDGAAARKALQRACRRLNEDRSWLGDTARTGDFVVTCVDLELENVEVDLKASVADGTLVRRLRKADALRRGPRN